MNIQPFDLNKHHCDVAVLKCIDFRFRESDQQFICEQFQVTKFDLLAWPGAAKSIVHDEVMREKNITAVKNVCVGLHSIKKLVILNHWDCGGYGGSKGFTSPEAEQEAYSQDLLQAKEIISAAIPGIEIILAYSRYEGEALEYHLI